MSRLPVSNAFDWSANLPKVNSPLSKDSAISFTKFKIAWCMEWFAQNKNCLRLFIAQWLRTLLHIILSSIFENTGRIDIGL